MVTKDAVRVNFVLCTFDNPEDARGIWVQEETPPLRAAQYLQLVTGREVIGWVVAHNDESMVDQLAQW